MKPSMRRYGAVIVGCLALGASVLAATAQATYQRPRGSGGSTVAVRDRMFMMETAKGGMAEVMAGKMAARKGRSERVKEFGQRMVDDHSKANEELKDLARTKRVTLPSDIGSKHRAMLAKLSRLDGAAFDRAYIMEMVNDHKMDVAAFRRESRNGQDADVKSWAGETLPTLREHLQMVTDIHERMQERRMRRQP